MRAAIACLVFAYVLSQFYRAFLAVLSPLLTADIGATPEDLAAASGLWFLAFSLMQIPVGSALDRVGPRWWNVCGNVYVVTAVKRVVGIRLIGAPWKRKKKRRSARSAQVAVSRDAF